MIPNKSYLDSWTISLFIPPSPVLSPSHNLRGQQWAIALSPPVSNSGTCKENFRSETATHLNWNFCWLVTVDTSKDQQKKKVTNYSFFIHYTNFPGLGITIAKQFKSELLFRWRKQRTSYSKVIKTQIYSLIPNVFDNTNIRQNISTVINVTKKLTSKKYMT